MERLCFYKDERKLNSVSYLHCETERYIKKDGCVWWDNVGCGSKVSLRYSLNLWGVWGCREVWFALATRQHHTCVWVGHFWQNFGEMAAYLQTHTFIVVKHSALFDRKFKDLILLHVADCIRVQQYMLSNSLTTPVYICFGLFANPQSELLG